VVTIIPACTSTTGHYRALEWVEESNSWESNEQMGIQVVVEVSVRVHTNIHTFSLSPFSPFRYSGSAFPGDAQDPLSLHTNLCLIYLLYVVVATRSNRKSLRVM
jgi:hypothetical protein